METVTIPRTEYDRLREAADMLDDVAAFDRAMADLTGRKASLAQPSLANDAGGPAVRHGRGFHP